MLPPPAHTCTEFQKTQTKEAVHHVKQVLSSHVLQAHGQRRLWRPRGRGEVESKKNRQTVEEEMKVQKDTYVFNQSNFIRINFQLLGQPPHVKLDTLLLEKHKPVPHTDIAVYLRAW
jgi:hypothetical protein